MELQHLFYRFGAALAVGALVGLERQYTSGDARKLVAGVRTFTLMSLVGCTGAFLADQMESALIFAAVILVMGLMNITAYILSYDNSPGITTEVVSLLVVLIGALCYWDYTSLAAALAVAITVLLNMKGEVKDFVSHLTPQDIRATLTFAVITVIILPILSREPIGEKPLDVLVPYRVWLMVVFISGISFAGYVLNKMVGTGRGIILAGLLGGSVSSTAATLTFAQRSQENHSMAHSFALSIMLAWTTMFPRILITVAVVNLVLLRTLIVPLIAMTLIGLGYCFYLYRIRVPETDEKLELTNPFELKPALQFGVLYAVILVFSRATQLYLDDAGIYLSSIVSGLVDLNAITLTVAELSGKNSLSELVAVEAIILATIANTIFKGGIVETRATPELRNYVRLGTLIFTLAGLLAMAGVKLFS